MKNSDLASFSCVVCYSSRNGWKRKLKMIFTARKATEGPCDDVGLLTQVKPVTPPDLPKCENLPSSNMQGRQREI